VPASTLVVNLLFRGNRILFRVIESFEICLCIARHMKRILCLLAALSFGVAPFAHAVTPLNLPIGDWTVNANGFHGVLHISGVDGVGVIQPGSTIFGNPIVGFYDSTSARISFIRVLAANPTSQQVYNGYLFKDTSNPFLFELAGEFAAYQGGGGVAQRIDYGWFASKSIIIILK
jgi:hypothetical protein